MSASPRNPPFRAEHIGSLLRPQELVEKRYAVADKSATPDSLVPVEQKAIKDVVQLQQEVGLRSITNGEYSRHMFWGTFFETLNGMEEINMKEGELALLLPDHTISRDLLITPQVATT
jgi:methionine synthase II (cobalamin-independent)